MDVTEHLGACCMHIGVVVGIADVEAIAGKQCNVHLAIVAVGIHNAGVRAHGARDPTSCKGTLPTTSTGRVRETAGGVPTVTICIVPVASSSRRKEPNVIESP